MYFPQSWVKAEGECEAPDRRKLKFAVWGWGADDGAARREAASRLQRVLNRVRQGEQLPRGYEYGSRPLREEVLQLVDGSTADQAAAVLTRNRYGAVVLNTARLLFLDVDVATEGTLQRLGRLFSRRPDPADAALRLLRETLGSRSRDTFRIYRTAAGLRAIAVDREYDPAGRDAQELMKQTGTDPAFMKLCASQRSFRARLTPKPWRCNFGLPPGEFPHPDESARKRYADWVTGYGGASRGYATCRFLETVGRARPSGQAQKLVELHDRLTRSGESLPLA